MVTTTMMTTTMVMTVTVTTTMTMTIAKTEAIFISVRSPGAMRRWTSSQCEERSRSRSNSRHPLCPRHYRARREAGPHPKGDKPFHCGCCAGTCERCSLAEGDGQRPLCMVPRAQRPLSQVFKMPRSLVLQPGLSAVPLGSRTSRGVLGHPVRACLRPTSEGIEGEGPGLCRGTAEGKVGGKQFLFKQGELLAFARISSGAHVGGEA